MNDEEYKLGLTDRFVEYLFQHHSFRAHTELLELMEETGIQLEFCNYIDIPEDTKF